MLITSISFLFCCCFKVAEYLSDPLCRGIFAGDTRLLSMRSCFPSVYQYENQHGSILKGAFLTKEGEHYTYSHYFDCIRKSVLSMRLNGIVDVITGCDSCRVMMMMSNKFHQGALTTIFLG